MMVKWGSKSMSIKELQERFIEIITLIPTDDEKEEALKIIDKLKDNINDNIEYGEMTGTALDFVIYFDTQGYGTERSTRLNQTVSTELEQAIRGVGGLTLKERKIFDVFKAYPIMVFWNSLVHIRLTAPAATSQEIEAIMYKSIKEASSRDLVRGLSYIKNKPEEIMIDLNDPIQCLVMNFLALFLKKATDELSARRGAYLEIYQTCQVKIGCAIMHGLFSMNSAVANTELDQESFLNSATSMITYVGLAFVCAEAYGALSRFINPIVTPGTDLESTNVQPGIKKCNVL
jgi:hypothetical protein